MVVPSARLRSLWKRTFLLGWPIATQQTLNTLMRTVDVLVTGLFSPAAVAAVGLSDLYADIPRRIGSSLGTGAITLSSQDTGRGAVASRDAAITQALILAVLAGLPFVFVGVLFGHLAIAVLGASAEVIRLGGLYLTIVFLVAPLRILGYVGAAALQGTGDTRTPLVANGIANVLNIVGTIVLGLGIGPIPRLGILGVAVATAVSRVFEASAIMVAIRSDRTRLSIVRPNNLTITRQLLAISTPRFVEQMSTAIVSFPFNALLLAFGTEVNAAYHIGRRIHQQIAAPLYRTYSLAASIIVGQSLGEGNPGDARFTGFAIAGFGVVTISIIATGLYVAAPSLAAIFSNDPPTIGFTIDFIRTYAVALNFMVVLFVFAGALRSAGDARTPLYAQFTGQFGFMLGFSYLVAIVLGYGMVGVYGGILLTYVWGVLVVGLGFIRGNWARTAAALIEERASSID